VNSHEEFDLKSQWEGGGENRHCAVLLFYAAPEVIDGHESPIEDAIANEIDIENREFAQRQALFSPATLEFIGEFGDTDTCLRYIFGVLAHSALDAEAGKFVSSFIKHIREAKEEHVLANFVVSHPNEVVEFCAGYSLENIRAAFVQVIDTALEVDFPFTDFIDKLISRLPEFTTKWRQVPTLAGFPRLFLKRSRNLDSELRTKWASAVITFITGFYSKETSLHARRNANFTELFDILALLNALGEPIILAVNPQEITNNSDHVEAYTKLISQIQSQKS
jgi:hypothetical protein